MFSEGQPAVKLANALQAEFGEMRTTILPGLIEAARRNFSRGLTDLAIFEEGSVFLPTQTIVATGKLPVGNQLPSSEQLATLNSTIPSQPSRLAALFTGDRVNQG